MGDVSTVVLMAAWSQHCWYRDLWQWCSRDDEWQCRCHDVGWPCLLWCWGSVSCWCWN